jgi:predicted Zn-dependent peptidase
LYQKTTLDNGLRLITACMSHTRSVSICFFIGAGSRYESEKQAGISHFIEHLCFRGTQKRATANDISVAIEGVGGILNGGTDKELTMYWSKVAQPHFYLALDVLTDMLLNSKFEPADIERERQIIIEEINMSKDSPSQHVNMLIDELLWPNHPLGRDVAGSKESMAKISRDMMLDYLKSRYSPENIVVTIAGNIQHQEALDTISRLTDNWKKQKTLTEYLAYEEQTNPRRRVEKRDTEQAHLCLGLPGLPLLHPKRFTLDLLNVILGEGMSSRLFTEIRDKMGLAYSIHSYIDHFLDSGALTIYAGVEPKNLYTVIKAILKQLDNLKKPINSSEISKAKELVKGRMLLRMEDTRAVAGWLGGQEVLTDRILTVDEVVSIIDKITAEDLKEIAEDIFISNRLRLAVVGPVDTIEPLEELLII